DVHQNRLLPLQSAHCFARSLPGIDHRHYTTPARGGPRASAVARVGVLCHDRLRRGRAAHRRLLKAPGGSLAMDVSRRNFIRLGTAGRVAGGALTGHAGEAAPVVLAQAGQPAPTGFDPADPALKYELVIANGEVLDPSQGLRGKRDIGIKYGQVAAVAPSIA